MKKDICAKCKKYTYVETHHVLPQNLFGGAGDLVNLCPNCHTEYHQKLGTKELKNPDMEFHFYKFYRWLYGVGIILLLISAFFYFK